jgi:hypothetical protein
MPFIETDTYSVSFFLRNSHINTMYPYLLRKKPKIPFLRKRYQTIDNDFFDVDWNLNNNRRVIILLHGLEGSSNSQYMVGTALLGIANHFDVAAFHFRSCSGEMNINLPMYHSGFTQDLHCLIEQIESDYEEIFICGFSLGGNVVMKYISDRIYSLSKKIIACAGVSVPCDLEGGSVKLMEFQNRLYEKNFLQSLLSKVKKKSELFPDILDYNNIKKVKTLWDFDEYYTSCLHGFKDAKDYYQKSSSLPHLKNINLPTLMINAKDDSFLSDASYPTDLAIDHDFFHLMVPEYGGHVGFSNFSDHAYWDEKQIINFFLQFSSLTKKDTIV